MKLWCYTADPGKWGEQLSDEARKNFGIDARIFTKPVDEMQRGDYAFMRIPQWEPECGLGKLYARELYDRGINLIPDFFTIYAYEDKVLQTQAYSDWMPKTFVLRGDDSWHSASEMAEQLGFPFISKSRRGSSSVNVRLVKSMEEAKFEWDMAMHGDGISMRTGKGRSEGQKGYLIWQKFCKGNSGDIRVCVNGRHVLMLERDNAHGVPFASGSGKNRPINDPDDFQICALDKAQKFFLEYNLKWNGIDLVYDYDEGDWKVLETTLGWSAKAYEDCIYFGTQWKGRDMFKVLCHEIRAGVFE